MKISKVIDSIEVKEQIIALIQNIRATDKVEVVIQEYDPVKYKTEAQNNTFHDLLTLYWASGEATRNYRDYDHMRTKFKLIAGLVKEYIYHNGEKFCIVKEKEDIPTQILLDGDVIQRPDSWRKVKRKGAIKAIDALINEMLANDVSSKKFDTMINNFNNRDW